MPLSILLKHVLSIPCLKQYGRVSMLFQELVTVLILFQIVVGTKIGVNFNMETVAEKAAAYALKHTETR